MLQTKTVTRETLELLEKLMQLPEIQQFVLVGGTNLALRFGHRLSIDLDLFTDLKFQPEVLYYKLSQHFDSIELASQSESMLFMYINDIKVDVVLLPYPLIRPVDNFNGIRLASVPDIVAMKLSAVARRGVKKDFWDLAELLDVHPMNEMIGFYKEKYATHDIYHLLRALVYFDDAELQIDPDPLKKMTWKQVKKKIEIATKSYINSIR